MTADDKYSVLNRGNLLQRFQMQLSQKRRTFPEFFFAFAKFRLNFQIFEKNMILIGDIFLTLRTPKNLVR